MTPSVTIACLVALQQLHVTPFPAEVGEPVRVAAEAAGQPLPGLAVRVELPDGSQCDAGVTGTDGTLMFVPTTPGQHVFGAQVGATRLLAPHGVILPRRPWLLAVVSLPLAVALLWRLSRARGRRGP